MRKFIVLILMALIGGVAHASYFTDMNMLPAMEVGSGQKNVATAGTAESLIITTTASTTGALPSCTYANGTSGVGATLTATSNGALTAQDGVTLVATNTILVKNQVSGLQNGVYTVTQVGDGSNPFILTRLGAYDQTAEMMSGTVIGVIGGTLNGGKQYQQTTSSPTLGSSSINFSELSKMLSVTVKAKPTNTGIIYIGNQYVKSAIGGILEARESATYDTDHLSDVWIDSSVNGDGVSYIFLLKSVSTSTQ